MNETTVVSENIKLTLYSTSLISIPCNNLTAFSLESRVTSHVPLSTLSTTARTVFRPVIASVSSITFIASPFVICKPSILI
jgi:hypothetical protein